MIKDWLFYSVLVSDVLLLLSMIVSLVFPEKRIYPPPKEKSWQNYAFLAFHHFALLGFFVLGGLDWNTFIFQNAIIRIVGGIVFVVGLGFAFWAVRTLSFMRSAGYNVALIDTGPYKFTRNPQVVSFIGFIGYILLVNSLETLIVGILQMAYVFLTPY